MSGDSVGVVLNFSPVSHGARTSSSSSIEVFGIGPSGEEGHTCFCHVLVDTDVAVEMKPSLQKVLHRILSFKYEMCCGDGETSPESSAVIAEDAKQLLELGAVWLIESSQRLELADEEARRRRIRTTSQSYNCRNDEGGSGVSCKKSRKRPRNPRPRRATMADAFYADWEGITIRVHHKPILFESVHDYDWGGMFRCSSSQLQDATIILRGVRVVQPHYHPDLDDTDTTLRPTSSKPGVVLHEDTERGYAILVKPPGVPVHGFVYNGVQNVAHQYRHRRSKRSSVIANANDDDGNYVSIPQRLDNGTSGILLVATTPSFASYASKLLEAKTESHLSKTPSLASSNPLVDSHVRKRYKCLVCVMKEASSASKLHGLADSGAKVTHYLSSKRSVAGIFVEEVPDKLDDGDATTTDTWKECQLRIIRKTADGRSDDAPVPVQGSAEADRLAINLWGSSGKDIVASLGCVAIMQVEVDLLTGRTHQIRGQMSAMGFPLVGDSLYGGGDGAGAGDRIALHCCQLSFPDPDVVFETRKKKERMFLTPSKEFNSFRCDVAWWNEYMA